MKQKLLFYAPNHYDIDMTIFNQLQEMDTYNIVKLTNKKYHYKNIFERIQNFLGKVFLKKVLKKEWLAKIQISEIISNEPFDLCLIIRPDLLETNVLQRIKNNIPVRKVIYWDSFKKVPNLKDTLPFFNDYFSFEEGDCTAYNLKRISNFYVHKASEKKPQYDAFFFGAKDKRFKKIELLTEYLYNKGWNAKALMVGKKPTKNSNFIEVIQQGIPFSKCHTFTENTKIVIDICHPNQKGLSIRPFEAMGLKRKLITNNIHIKDYAFYNKNNIFILENFENIEIPDSFLETPYQELPEDIYEKYHIHNWLKNILK